MWSRPAAMRVIVAGGCLAAAYSQLTMSPATVDFTGSLGGSAVHVGILNALPSAMLFLQFAAAVLANHLRFRRPVWFVATIVQRSILIPVACGPWLFPEVPDAVWLWAFVGATALNHGLIHFGTPLWMSWMGDYLPKIGLSTFWGQRHLWMQWSAALSLAGAACLLKYGGLPIRESFAWLTLVGAVLGTIDILLFLRVEEPPVTPVAEPALRSVLAAPFRHGGFRTFIGYTCFWNLSAMIGAPFISLYLRRHVGMEMHGVLLLWTASWVGGAVLSGWLGRLSERVGSRPVLVVCTEFKAINMVALLLVPQDPFWAYVILVPVFMADAVLNAGIAIATNGFLLKYSPAENRTMFIASGTALAGMVGGATSILCGLLLYLMRDLHHPFGPFVITGFHVLFAVSLLFRRQSVRLAKRISDPHALPTSHVVSELIGADPWRVLRFPIGLYRSLRDDTGSGANGTGPSASRIRLDAADLDREPNRPLPPAPLPARTPSDAPSPALPASPHFARDGRTATADERHPTDAA